LRLKGLVSANHLNGEEGIIQKYVIEKNRYQVKVTSVDRKGGNLAVKRENLEIIGETSTPSHSKPSMHVLIPCHLTTDHRFE
jgi:hypothetical protein